MRFISEMSTSVTRVLTKVTSMLTKVKLMLAAVKRVLHASLVMQFAVLLLVSLPVAAQENSASQKQAPSTHENFDRLFTTAKKRAYLDANRHEFVTTAIATGSGGVVDTNSNPQAPQVRLTGVLLRADGKHQVWLEGNGDQNQKVSADTPTVSADNPDTITVRVHSQRKSVALKPGQVWLPQERRVEESYNLSPTPPVIEANKSPPDQEQTGSAAASEKTVLKPAASESKSKSKPKSE